MTDEGNEEDDLNVGGYNQTQSPCKVLWSKGVKLDAISGGVHQDTEDARGWVPTGDDVRLVLYSHYRLTFWASWRFDI